MKKNFKVENLTDLCLGSQRFDVHNDFDFSRFGLSLSEATADITWLRSDRQEEQLVLSFSGVNFLSVRLGDVASANSSVTKVIGFLDAEFRDDFNSFDYDKGAEDRDFVVILENDTSLKISCDEANVDVIK